VEGGRRPNRLVPQSVEPRIDRRHERDPAELAGPQGSKRLVGRPEHFAVATLGAAMALKGFVAFAIGGLGSLPGALVGGLAVGLVESLSGRWLGSAFSTIMVFVVLAVILSKIVLLAADKIKDSTILNQIRR
jgi:hypothetical protein